MARDQNLRRFVVFALVAGAHGLLFLLPLDTVERREREGNARRTVLFFTRTIAVERRPLPLVRPLAEPTIETNIAIDAPTAITAEPPSGSSTAGPEARPSINWSEEAQRAAAAVADKATTPDPSKCDSTGLADPALPNCKPPRDFKWAPPKSGFANGLPYVTVGDRCVIGLGFFGCSIGKPPANGKLFDGMNDPNRPRGGVPESQ